MMHNWLQQKETPQSDNANVTNIHQAVHKTETHKVSGSSDGQMDRQTDGRTDLVMMAVWDSESLHQRRQQQVSRHSY